jgi:hypothetical protein
MDPKYDSFKYFYDFCLDTLSWKLGGYIDDHSGDAVSDRRFGFLELAPGRLNVSGELSRPATSDPWLLNQLIHEIVSFYDIQPHSLHISLQLRRRQVGKQHVLPLGFVQCLLVLGGGVEQLSSGKLWVSRIGTDEIKRWQYGEELVFARTNKRSWYLGEDQIASQVAPPQATTVVQQYKFMRLDERANYEALILCFKGLQLECNPGDYLTARQLKENLKLRADYEQLKQWGREPTPIDKRVIKDFIKTVRRGLMRERNRRPAHKLHYIRWALNAVEVQLRIFNKRAGAQMNRS